MTSVLLVIALVALVLWMAASIVLGWLWNRQRAQTDRAVDVLRMLGYTAW
jgi:ABC-type Fe3+ transport system permease subunit